MSPAARRLLARGAVALILLALLAAAWTPVAATYTRTIGGVANALAPSAVRVSAEGTGLVLTYETNRYPRAYHARMGSVALQGGMLMVVALVLATPRLALRAKGLWVVAALAGFLAAHGLTLALFAWAYRWQLEGGPVTLTGLVPAVPLVYVALPAFLGGAWAYTRWSVADS